MTSATTSGPSALDLVTLSIAVLGLVVAVVGLTWQFVQHRLSGSVVKVELVAGALGRGGVVSGPLSAFDHAYLAGQGFGEAVVGVRGRNTGRLAVDVTGWNVMAASKFAYSLPGFGLNPDVPYRLEPGSEVTFFCPMADVVAMLSATEGVTGKADDRVRGSLSLGSGRIVRTDLERLPGGR